PLAETSPTKSPNLADRGLVKKIFALIKWAPDRMPQRRVNTLIGTFHFPPHAHTVVGRVFQVVFVVRNKDNIGG
ncbi:MAG: hypothetical protein RL417_2445, partial [Pseudomonadota bacterium]